MWTAVRLTIALATCAVLLAAVIVSVGPALSLGEPPIAPRLLRESGPIEARLPDEYRPTVCDCFTTIPGPPEHRPMLELAGGLSSILYEPPSRDIDVADILPTSRPVGERVYGAPPYPKKCIRRRAEGSIEVEFDITPEGTTSNIRILESPDPCFDAAVLRYVAKWRYRPESGGDGSPVWRRRVKEVLIFELDE